MKNKLRGKAWQEMGTEITRLQGPSCLLPSCQELWAHKAHIDASGMGGSPSTFEVTNIVGLCPYHHDVFDNRQPQGRQELMRELMRFMLHTIRQTRAMDATQGLDTLNYPEGSR